MDARADSAASVRFDRREETGAVSRAELEAERERACGEGQGYGGRLRRCQAGGAWSGGRPSGKGDGGEEGVERKIETLRKRSAQWTGNVGSGDVRRREEIGK